MARILNSVLISLLAFVGLLAAFAFSGLRGSEGSPPPGHAAIRALRAAWGSDASGTQVVATVALHNPGPAAAEAARATLEVEVDGTTFAEESSKPAQPLPAGKDAEVRLAAGLGEGFAPRFWAAHAAAGESSRMVLRGEVVVVEGKAERHLPFEWKSSWSGDTPAAVAALAGCPSASSPVCVESAVAAWRDGALHATLTLHNDGPADVAADGTLSLAFAGRTVAAGPVSGTVPAGGSAPVETTLSFDDGALAAWWPEHVRSCESSPVQAGLDLRLREADGWDAGRATLQGPEQPWPGTFLCGGGGA